MTGGDKREDGGTKGMTGGDKREDGGTKGMTGGDKREDGGTKGQNDKRTGGKRAGGTKGGQGGQNDKRRGAGGGAVHAPQFKDSISSLL